MEQVIKDFVSKSFTEPVIAIIPYGSRVYKNKPPADYDFHIIIDTARDIETNVHGVDAINIEDDKVEAMIQSIFTFTRNLDLNRVAEVEILFTPFDTENYFITDDLKSKFEIYRQLVVSPVKMRHAFCEKSNNSYSRAGKRLTMEEDADYTMSMKSVWHSIRMIEFGIQIMSKGQIDFQSCNELYTKIEKIYADNNSENKKYMWEEIKKQVKPIFNDAQSRFRKFCPKM